MKLLYIVSNPFHFQRNPVGGMVSSASGVINGFVSAGYEVHILTDTNIPTITDDMSGVSVIHYPYRIMRRFIPVRLKGPFGKIVNKIDQALFHLATRIGVSSVLKSNDYDLVYLRASFNGHTAARLVRKHGLRLILEVNKPLSMAPYNRKGSGEWPVDRSTVSVPATELVQYQAATLITVDSTYRANWVIDTVGNGIEKKILVNHNGVNISIFSPRPRKKELFQNLGFDHAHVVVGMASSFRWYNDIDELVLIIQAAISRSEWLRFLILSGDEEKKNELSKKLRLAGLDDAVKVVLRVPFDQMPDYYAVCDILISHFNFHGSWPHNCSIKHLEYLAMGKPAVATAVGEVNFAIEHDVNGVLCAEGEVEQFSDAIVRLASSPEWCNELGRAGRKKAENSLSWDANVHRILERI